MRPSRLATGKPQTLSAVRPRQIWTRVKFRSGGYSAVVKTDSQDPKLLLSEETIPSAGALLVAFEVLDEPVDAGSRATRARRCRLLVTPLRSKACNRIRYQIRLITRRLRRCGNSYPTVRATPSKCRTCPQSPARTAWARFDGFEQWAIRLLEGKELARWSFAGRRST